jgi:hypothetical protein
MERLKRKPERLDFVLKLRFAPEESSSFKTVKKRIVSNLNDFFPNNL